ncbi:MAG: potassium channel family protein [Spirosomataceae bacterium]
MKQHLLKYRFEFLLIILTLAIFDKIVIFSDFVYSSYVWPANMLLLGVGSFGLFHDRNLAVKWAKNIFFISVIAVPLAADIIFVNSALTQIALWSYLFFYTIIFTEVIRQIIHKHEVTESIIMGSLSGFLLIIVVATFSFLLIDFHLSDAFQNLQGVTIPQKYHQVVYFSSITLTTIGYGDITPKADNARLLAAFWGVVGQFYMVAVVGIIISKFTSK